MAALTRATASTTTPAMAGAALVAGQHGVDLASTPRSSMPVITAVTSSGSISGPRQAPYPVWLEKFTVSTGQTSWPSRCSGKTAAELPTWP